jgi:hypothetical protein
LRRQFSALLNGVHVICQEYLDEIPPMLKRGVHRSAKRKQSKHPVDDLAPPLSAAKIEHAINHNRLSGGREGRF